MFLSRPPPKGAQYRNKIYLLRMYTLIDQEKGRGGGVSNLHPGEMREDSDMSYRYQEGLRVVVVSKLKEREPKAQGKYSPPPYIAHLAQHFIMYMDVSCILEKPRRSLKY